MQVALTPFTVERPLRQGQWFLLQLAYPQGPFQVIDRLLWLLGQPPGSSPSCNDIFLHVEPWEWLRALMSFTRPLYLQTSWISLSTFRNLSMRNRHQSLRHTPSPPESPLSCLTLLGQLLHRGGCSLGSSQSASWGESQTYSLQFKK